VIGADGGTGAGFDASARAARGGGAGMDTVIDDTHAGVAVIAPSTDTPAGKAALVAHLQYTGCCAPKRCCGSPSDAISNWPP